MIFVTTLVITWYDTFANNAEHAKTKKAHFTGL